MTKLERIGTDLKRAREKQAEWNQRVKDLENRYREEENGVIHSMVQFADGAVNCAARHSGYEAADPVCTLLSGKKISSGRTCGFLEYRTP